MANKLILVPEEIYRGLTSSNFGEPNLDFSKKEVEKAKRKKEHHSNKNIHYNQELRRYLQLRNESANRPVKVQMVANPKGAIMNTSVTRPASNIVDDEDDDLWMSDDFSYSAYPREPPVHAYNIVPSPSIPSSSHPPSLPISRRNSPTQPSTSKENILPSKPSKRISRISTKKIKKVSNKIKKKKRTNEKSKEKTEKIPPEINTIIEAQNAPLSSSSSPPPIRMNPVKRKTEEVEGLKRRKVLGIDEDENKDNEQKDQILEQKISARTKQKKAYLKRKETLKNKKSPIDEYALSQARFKDKIDRIKRKKIAKDGRSPSPPISRQKIKRKLQVPSEQFLEHLNETSYAKRWMPVPQKVSERAGKLWIKKLKSKNIKIQSYKVAKKKWATRKPTQADIKGVKKKNWATRKPTQTEISNFKPSLW
ncbi:unnamed protein product [Meloidogyne enterolobii]|uniref:Uncharacterized protein n=1 Tax=Meloidogyne enterolobii TaxID=390850 RepID=A0ACB0ZXL9_MELEN